ncbi:hypothetical protein A2477_01000 [Candidatus Falkowbacteria bacterium RIFOXYC2_FULL_47_12]|uniref:Uncharacterized protein n=2 Tax=Candidatus Falkowiibacteriota TaxID=1752728 RepID=A0A1F5TS34_9BACT|nr:MAG: hypothetical protein A2242_01960 [Candidatus Falkowbacteria bacterium RIFOXYA2_FULL_47_9]OGF41745.1 MAG: hypothetical protein A2477_01000 [Candidatus Falkowbacteria bacterium RIFOXYC2_FULL_47_12]
MALKDFFAKFFGKGQETPMQMPQEPAMPQAQSAATPLSEPEVHVPQSIEDVEKMPEPKMPLQQQ